MLTTEVGHCFHVPFARVYGIYLGPDQVLVSRSGVKYEGKCKNLPEDLLEGSSQSRLDE